MEQLIKYVIENARLLVENQYTVPITKTNPYLYNVSHTCMTNKEIMGQIPAQYAGYVGFAYMHILSLTSETIVHQTYSTISFYFLEKTIRCASTETYKDIPYVETLNSAIILMNIGARSIYRTFAQAYGRKPNDYVNFTSLHNLPVYVKEVLLCEYSYFVELENVLTLLTALMGDNTILKRYDFLKNCINEGYFDEIGLPNELYSKAKQIRERVYNYAAKKIEKGEIVFR